MGSHLVVQLSQLQIKSSVAQSWRLILHQDNYSDSELCTQSLLHLSPCSMCVLSALHIPIPNTAPQPRIRWDNLVMAAKHSPSKPQYFGGDSQLPPPLDFPLVFQKQFSPFFQSRLLSDSTNGFSLPKAEFSSYYYFVYKPPSLSISSPVPGLIPEQIASSSPSPSSSGRFLSSSPQSIPNRTQLSC